MFGFFDKTRRELVATYQTMLNAASPEARVNEADKVLQLVEKISDWPISFPSQTKIIGNAHGNAGFAYHQLAQVEPHFSENAINSCEQSIKYLELEPDIDLAIVYHTLSSSYASSTTGSHGENIENSIKYGQFAIDLLEKFNDVILQFDILVSLASYYAERQLSNPKENLEKAISLAQEALALKSHLISQEQLAKGEMTLGNILAKRLEGNPQENIELAVNYLESALGKAFQCGHKPLWAAIHANLSLMYLNNTRKTTKAERFEKAFSSNSHALDFYAHVRDARNWGMSLADRAVLLMEKDNEISEHGHKEAENLFQQALEILNNVDFPRERALVLQNYSILMNSGQDSKANRDSAIHSARAAVDTFDVNKDPLAWAHAKFALGNTIYKSKDDNLSPEKFDEAIDSFESAMKILTPERDLDRWIMASTNLSNCYAERKNGFKKENIEKAIKIQTEALNKTDLHRFLESWLHGMRNLALSYLSRIEGIRADNVEYAIIHLDEALIAATESNNPRERANLFETLGDALFARERGKVEDNVRKAEFCFREAKYLRRHSENSGSDMRLELKLTQVAQSLQKILESNKERATETNPIKKIQPNISTEKYINDLKAYADSVSKENSPSLWIASQVRIADALKSCSPDSDQHDDLDSFTEAMLQATTESISYYEKARSAIDEDNDPDGISSFFERIGNAYNLMFMMAEAKDCGWDNLQELSKINPNRSPRTTKYLLKANEYYRAALELPCRAMHPNQVLSLTCSVGESYFKQRDWENAQKYFQKAADIADHLLGEVEAGRKDLEPVLVSLGTLVKCAPLSALMLGNVKEAIELNEAARARLLAKSLTLKTLPFNDEQRTRLNSLQESMIIQEQRLMSDETFDRRVPLEEIIKLRASIRETVAEIVTDLKVRLNYQEILDQLTINGTIVIVPLINNLIGKLLVFHKNADYTNPFIVDVEDDFALNEIFRSRTAANANLYAIRKAGSDRDKISWAQQFENDIDTLSNAIIKPLTRFFEKLQLPQNTKILFLSHGTLSMLPINLAFIDPDDTFMIDRYEVTFSPSLQTSHFIKSSRNNFPAHPLSATILARPTTEGDKQKELLFASIERRLIKSWFPGNNGIQIGYEGQKITESELLHSLDGSDIWHICAHAGFDVEEPLNSQIDLGIVKLSLQTLFNTSALKPPRLVVLSACDTAFHGVTNLPQEFIGMSTAFLQLGAGGVIAAQWDASDFTTTLLMGKLYEFMMKECLRPSDALRRSQQWLRNVTSQELTETIQKWKMENRLTQDGWQKLTEELAKEINGQPSQFCPFANPHYWGPFVYFGE